MNERKSTHNLLKEIQLLKYKYALLPLILVIGSFFLSVKLPLNTVRILSLTGMILYLILLFKFRIGRAGLETKSNEILSPVYGIIKSIEEKESNVEVVIYKNYFVPCGIRFTFDNDVWENESLVNSKTNVICNFSSKKILKNRTDQSTQGNLAGFLLSSSECVVSLPKNKIAISVKTGEKCFAGKTTLGIYNEN